MKLLPLDNFIKQYSSFSCFLNRNTFITRVYRVFFWAQEEWVTTHPCLQHLSYYVAPSAQMTFCLECRAHLTFNHKLVKNQEYFIQGS